MSAQLKGPLHKLKLTQSLIDLNQFQLDVVSNNSEKRSKVFVSKFKSKNAGGKINFDNLSLDWQGDHTFRRVTRANKRNSFSLNGHMTLDFIDILNKKESHVIYNLSLANAFFSVNFPEKFTGDIIASNIRFLGNQIYSWHPIEKQRIRDSLGTTLETGPTLSGSLVFRDGVFNIPKRNIQLNRPRVKLNLNTIIGPGNYIEGSFTGDGLYQLASNVFLELDERKNGMPFSVKGTLNAPQFNTKLYFYEGAVSILDGVYELMSKNEQNHYFRDLPDQITDQYVEISPNQIGDNLKTSLDFRLRALRKIDDKVATDNIRNEKLPYDAVGLAMNGDFLNESKITVFDLGIQNLNLSFPEHEIYGVYEVDLTGSDATLSQTSFYGINLLLPKIITNSDDTNFTSYGRQRINSFIRSSIRPYERRLAKRIGLYDFRLNYDFGRTILSAADEDAVNEDLLGLQMVSNLYKERLFLTLRSDVNLSSDYTNENARGVKITQVDFSYYIRSNFMISLKNASEYSEVSIFDPRWALSYAYSF